MQTEEVAKELATWEARTHNMGISGQVHYEENQAVFNRMAGVALNDWKQPRWMLRDGLVLACLNAPTNDIDSDAIASTVANVLDDYFWQMADHVQHFIEVRYPV